MSKLEVKVSLTPEERDHLDTQAKALSLSRSALIRLRALGDPTPGVQPQRPPLTVRQYQEAVTAALKASNGSCPRNVVEAIAASVLCSIHQIDDKQTSPSHPQAVG